MSLVRIKESRWSFCVLGLLGLLSGCDGVQTKASPPVPAAVHGSVYVLVPDGSKGRVILLPDIEVFLHNVSSGDESAPVTTDLYGRYRFPDQKPGTYQLQWKSQLGWAAGSHPDSIVIKDYTQYPTPARVVAADRKGIVFGRVSLSDGDSPWFYDELFSTKVTPSVTMLNAARTLTLTSPVHANAGGYYAVAGLDRGQSATVRVKSEAATVTRSVAATSISVGNVVAPVDVELPNHRPQVVTVVPESGGLPVRTAPPGATIKLRAVTRDADGDPLQYDWKLLPGNGSVASAGSSAQWTLPTTRGTYSVYLQVKDARGGYVRNRVSFEVGKTDDSFSGRLVDQSGTPVNSASVSINGTFGSTNANGFFQIPAPLSKRYVLNITKRGYALFSRITRTDMMGQTWVLVKAQEQLVDPRAEIVLVDRRPELERQKRRGVRITVPANALVDAGGKAPTGSLTGYVATLNIGAGEAPGDWGARSGTTETNLISYGAAFVEFLDAAGNKFNLAAGTSARVEMPTVGSLVASAPATTALWSYDESDGYWKPSGSATLNAAAGQFTGNVTRFSTINTDLSKTDAACIKVLLYPPIPTGVKLKVSDPTGAVFGQSFEFVLNAAINAVYRLPSNTNVKLELTDATGNAFSGLILEEVPGTPLPSNVINSGPAIPAGHTLWPDEPYDDCKLAILRLDIQANPSVFLTFMGEGTAAQAAGYYSVIDPNNLRTTLGDWLNTNGFTLGLDGIPTNAVRTSYLNDNDLGSGRDMYFLQRPDGTVAAYVTNYGLFDQNPGNADLAATRTNPGATVAMEYSPVEGEATGTRIVKFFVFAGNGNGPLATRQEGAELDGFGVKYVPNLCLNCHGGDYSPANAATPAFADVNAQASFRELDLATYKYPAGRTTPNATEKDFFKQQNLIVKGLNPGDLLTRQAIKDLIAGWYAGASTDQDNSYTPTGWTGSPQQGLYHDVVKGSCRTCHVAFVASENPSGINWNRYDQLKARRGFLSSFVLCDDRFMPHALITYRNFWLSGSPHRPGALRNFSDANWPALGQCP